MKEAANLVSKLSPHLFWDVAPEIINPSDNKKLIIKRVLEYGIWEDWLLLKEFYGIEGIAGTAKGFRELDRNLFPLSLQFQEYPKRPSDVILRNSWCHNTGTSKKSFIN